MLIQESGERRILGLGVVFEGYDSHWMPGWEAGTVGYHVDDGKIFEAGFEDFGRDVEGNKTTLREVVKATVIWSMF